MEFTKYDRAFLAGVTVAHMLSPALVRRIVAALAEPESARQARAALAAALSHKDGHAVDAALDALLEAVVERDAADESHEDDDGAD